MSVNSYVDAINEEEYKVHMSKALMMDLGDMTAPRMDINMFVNEGIPILDTDDNEHVPSVNVDGVIQTFDIPPL